MWKLLAFLSETKGGGDIIEVANEGVRTACSCPAQGHKEEETLCFVKTGSRTFWSWGRVFPDREGSQLIPRCCPFLQGSPWGLGEAGKEACSRTEIQSLSPFWSQARGSGLVYQGNFHGSCLQLSFPFSGMVFVFFCLEDIPAAGNLCAT